MRYEDTKKFFLITGMLNKSPVGVEICNENAILKHGHKKFDLNEGKRRGFRHFNTSVAPLVLHTAKLGRKPLDFEELGSVWMLSEAAKDAISELCGREIDLYASNIIFDDKSPGQKVWLCDVTIVLDALNEGLSKIRVTNFGEKMYHISVPRADDCVFYRSVVQGYNIFRMKYAQRSVIVSIDVKKMFAKRRLKGAMFFDIGFLSD